ncbi:type II secretion system protein GspM [Fundidesulfovibrio soli]|uniref:type II secretion system protein GspM n=1 Tax=Fundidesulfovibrio soli TaxID=2922716 RepID=UPI001FB03210|nr:type II secretion system protein GspM [Fundidesulfovibrio soli]
MNFTRQHALYAGGGLAVVVALWAWVIQPYSERSSRLDRQLAEATQQLAQARALQNRLGNASEFQQKPAQPADFSLFGRVDALATTHELKANITSMQPTTKQLPGNKKESQLDVKMNAVDLKNLLAFLKDIEDDPAGVRVRSLILTKTGDGGLNAELSLAVGISE